MGKQVDQIIKTAGAILVGDIVQRLGDQRLLRVTAVRLEYDYDVLHAEWLAVVDMLTGVSADEVCASRVTYPLNEMEVIAWASR